jgi:hypothetical protein
MSDRDPYAGSTQDPARVVQRGAPPYITTSSRPQADGSRAGQYPAGSFAQPPSSAPQRTVSEPYPPPSPASRGTPTRASSGDVPMSAGYVDSNLRLLKGSTGDKGTSGRSGDKTKRRHSHEPKVNGYTECGRHGDDWLFGGFSVSGSVKKLWERDKKA